VSSSPKESNAVYSLRDPSEVNLTFNCLHKLFENFLFVQFRCTNSLCLFMLVSFGPDVNLSYVGMYTQVMEFLKSLVLWKSNSLKSLI